MCRHRNDYAICELVLKAFNLTAKWQPIRGIRMRADA